MTTLHTGHCCAVYRMAQAEKLKLAEPIIKLLRAIPTVQLRNHPTNDDDGPRDRTGIARRGGSVYDDILSAEPRDALAVACARNILIEQGAANTVIDALERCELLDTLSIH